MIKRITDSDNNLLALIVNNEYPEKGIQFFSKDEDSLQAGAAFYPTGTRVDAHLHNKVERTIYETGEVIIMEEGQYRVDFYDNDRNYIKSRILKAGDIMICLGGCHGFKSIENVKLTEVKQGPYVLNTDKTRFQGIDDDKVILMQD